MIKHINDWNDILMIGPGGFFRAWETKRCYKKPALMFHQKQMVFHINYLSQTWQLKRKAQTFDAFDPSL